MDSEVQVVEYETETEYFSCDCGTEVLAVEYDHEFDEFYCSIYEFRRSQGLRAKWHYIWHILRYGSPYGDQVCLNKYKADRLSKFIQEHRKDDVSA